MALPSQLLLESFEPLKESLLWGHVFFLRGLPLRFGAESKRRRIIIIHSQEKTQRVTIVVGQPRLALTPATSSHWMLLPPKGGTLVEAKL